MNGGGHRRDIGAGRKAAPLDDHGYVRAGSGLAGIDLLNLRRGIGRDIGVRLLCGKHAEGRRDAYQDRA